MDDIEQIIIAGGYIRNDQIWRKWTVSQMLRYGRTIADYTKYFITGEPYVYEWTTARDEINTISKLSSAEERYQRSKFFNASVIIDMANHYKININAKDKEMSLYLCDEVIVAAKTVQKHANKYKMAKLVKMMNKFISTASFPSDTPKSDAWKNAFIGAGSYYTMDNLIKFHNCHITDNGIVLDIDSSLSKLNEFADENQNHYDKLYAVMNDFIAYNHFELANMKP